MTAWELAACIDGYNMANGAETPPPIMSGEEISSMIERHRPFANRVKTRH